MSRSYRAVFVDVDGTLLSGSKRATDERDRAAVAAVRAGGVGIYLNTGRSTHGALPLQRALGADSPVFCYNGSVVHDPASGRDLERLDVDERAVVAALSRAAEDDGIVYCFTDAGIVTHGHTDEVHGFLVERLSRAGITELPDASGLPTRGVVKLWVLVDPGAARLLEAETAGMRCRWVFPRVDTFVPEVRHGSRVLMSATGAMHLKRAALDWLARTRGVRLEEMVAIGDHENDLEALEAAGLAVAVEGASDAILSVADMVIAAPERSGVAAFLEELTSHA